MPRQFFNRLCTLTQGVTQLVLLFGFLLCCQTVNAQQGTVAPDTWVCCDGLQREVPVADSKGMPAAVDENQQVGVFYYLWHGQHGAEIKDNTRILEADPVNPEWGPEGAYHWGGKPVLGYYRGGDPYIVARHMQMLMDAGVDFYYFDTTNGPLYEDNVRAVMREIDRRQALGLRTPKLAFCIHTKSPEMSERLRTTFFADPANEKYWFLWQGKPLLLYNGESKEDMSQEVKDRFTLRESWAWQPGEDRWPWLETYPQGGGTHRAEPDTEPVLEQICVSTAQHPSTLMGKSYHAGAEPEVDAYGLCKETPYGLFFQEQWETAVKRHAPVTMITQWNEWIAMRFVTKNESDLAQHRPGHTMRMGESFFIDVYNQEFSRDIEPSSEPLIRDNYYLQMVSGIRRMRGARPLPVASAPKTIQMEGDFSQWEDVQPEYRDEPGDCVFRSWTAQSPSSYFHPTNDLVAAKVAEDKDNLYFYAEVDARGAVITPLAEQTSQRWMTLLLNVDRDYTNGWEGYDAMVSNRDGKVYLYVWDKEKKNWKEDRTVKVKVSDRKLMLTLTRKSVGIRNGADFDFKWIDNVRMDSREILDFLRDGDAAPNGRFNYRYKHRN